MSQVHESQTGFIYIILHENQRVNKHDSDYVHSREPTQNTVNTLDTTRYLIADDVTSCVKRPYFMLSVFSDNTVVKVMTMVRVASSVKLVLITRQSITTRYHLRLTTPSGNRKLKLAEKFRGTKTNPLHENGPASQRGR